MSTTEPAHRVQSAVVEYGYPQGHLGHLSEQEEVAFTKFKVTVAEHGYDLGNGEGGTHDDATLLRFLRARRFVVPDALKQFEDTEAWRKANELDKLYETIDLDHFDETRRLYPQWTGRRDRRGIPVYVFEVKHLNHKTMAAYEKSAKETHTKAQSDGKTPAKLLRLFALYENLIRFVMPLCSALTDRDHPRTPITQSNNIVDISGVGIKQFWNLRTHMQDASTLATAHYPETLDRIFIIGAPAFFPTVWGWIKKWFDPITTSKIFILSHHDMKKTLESFIDPVNIPKKYGGELDFNFGDMPVLDPQLENVLKWEEGYKDFPHGPMYWVKEGKHVEEDKVITKVKALAVGHKSGKQRDEEVCTVTTTLRNDEDVDSMNSGTAPASINEKQKYPESRPELVSLPTDSETPPQYPPQISKGTNENSKLPEILPARIASLENGQVIEDGEILPGSRPEPQTFVTAMEDLTLKEQAVPNGSAGPHSTATANLLDPNVKLGGQGEETEDAHKHHEADDKTDIAVGGGAGEADKAHVGT